MGSKNHPKMVSLREQYEPLRKAACIVQRSTNQVFISYDGFAGADNLTDEEVEKMYKEVLNFLNKGKEGYKQVLQKALDLLA